ncbi:MULTISPECIES: DUF262 domain-containing protein [Butyricimonas]|uniref:GmrSD restriction endonuclease domain-containing protein n=1 Tax=Butyricimonas TaxID=574697 RepID=UPI00208C48FD|nr:DUF262 domain-containing protein [Butyricimonas paravirosa]BDF54659.1 hypothetical protein CE91St21_20940 [Odoribacteraceae bacterium]GKH93521.1 hypothetical protein CE91St23_20170 [Odoribacteraceae bacterium]GKH99593.1 hypothetical protein CE91St22_34710 [Odoribacteraceae bacterium]GKI05231.1 hypothetical protein CE91St24_45060 [Odoribacteraceae bacterium]
MATLFREVNYKLQALVNDIDMGVIGLPDIQRPFVWKDIKVRDLFDSMYKGYPVGYLLLWANANVDNSKYIGVGGKQKIPNLLIVDGQQRLTSIFAVMKGKEVIRENFNKEHIIISFKPLEEKFEIPDAASRRSSEYVQDISKLWQPDFKAHIFIGDFIKNLEASRALTEDEKAKIWETIQNVKNLEHYSFSALELSANISEEEVSDIFVRINSQGKTLNQADFILTLMSVFWDEGRTDLERFCHETRTPNLQAASAFNYIITPSPDQMLRVSVGLCFKRAVLKYVYSILRGKDLETGTFSEERREKQFELLKEANKKVLDVTNWHEYLKCIKQAGYIKGDIISSKTTIIYVYTMFLIGREEYKMDMFELRKLISQWFFMCIITGRYTGSPESQMEFDLSQLRGVYSVEQFKNILLNIINTKFTDDFWNITLPNNLATSSAISPSMYAYYASLNILNADGLFSKMKVHDLLQEGLRSKKSPLEIHHLFPKAYLISIGITEQQQTNQIANYALVEWSDNIKIADTAPAEYLPKYLSRLTPEQQKQQYYWHALPDGWERMNYFEFLRQRRSLMAQTVKDAFSTL